MKTSHTQSHGIIVSDSFHKQLVEIDLTLACVGELNTTIRGGIHWPIIYGVGELTIKLCFISVAHNLHLKHN
jgi:hypothetical protein